MTSSFEQRESDYYFSKCDNYFSKKKIKSPHIQYAFVAEHSSSYAYVPPPVQPALLTGELLQQTLDTSFESAFLFPGKNTFFLMDLSKQTDTPYNSLMFQLDDSPMKSTATTKEIMDCYFEEKGVPYSAMTRLGDAFGYKQRLPYVVGETFLVPNRGPSKQPASWVALHHVFHTIPDTKKGEVLLFAEQHHLLTLPYNKESFESQIDRTAHFYFIGCKFKEDCLRHFEDTRETNLKENIIHKRLDSPYPLPDFTWSEFMDFLVESRSWKAMCTVFEKDSPYLQDIQLSFKLPPNHL